MDSRFCADEMVCARNRVLAAIVGLRAWGTLAFEAAFHRLGRARSGKAVERTGQEHDGHKADDDSKAALHL